MINRCLMAVLILTVSMSGSASLRATTSQAQTQLSQSHTAWVADVLKRMQTVKVGMTRSELLNSLHYRGRPLHRSRSHVCQPRLPVFQGRR
jgi:hypothetical protein